MRLKTLARIVGLLGLFAFAFGYEEASIVLYLRRIAFPPGPSHVLYLESGREAATLAVLAIVAWLSGRREISRPRAFLVVFGLWDIAYYAWLYALSGSPTLTSNDVLFLLPVPWVAPVWSAVAFAVVLVAAGVAGVQPKRRSLFVAGLVVGFLSFIAQGIGIAHAYPIPLFVLAVALAITAIDLPLRTSPQTAGPQTTQAR